MRKRKLTKKDTKQILSLSLKELRAFLCAGLENVSEKTNILNRSYMARVEILKNVIDAQNDILKIYELAGMEEHASVVNQAVAMTWKSISKLEARIETEGK